MPCAKTHPRCAVEELEDRLTPSYDWFYNPASDTWLVRQVQPSGNATIRVDPANNLSVTTADGASGVGVAPGSLNITTLNNANNVLNLDLDGHLGGGVTVNRGHGVSVTNFTGDANSMDGNFQFRAGNNAQLVQLGQTSALRVGGLSYVDLGLGSDTVTATAGLRAGMDLTFRGVNYFDDGPGGVTVGRNFNVLVNNETQSTTITLNSGAASVGSGFNYVGNNANEVITFQAAVVGGSVVLNLANGNSTVTINSTTIGGGLVVLGGSGTESVTVDNVSVVGGSIAVNTGTIGPDTVTLHGTIGGGSVVVRTGLSADSVTYGMTGNSPAVVAILGLGNDTFRLDPGLLRLLYVDFDGGDDDQFQNNYGAPFTFPVRLLNLP